MAVLAGLEPTTRCLEGSCSVQMSYRTIKILHIIPKTLSIDNKGQKKRALWSAFFIGETADYSVEFHAAATRTVADAGTLGFLARLNAGLLKVALITDRLKKTFLIKDLLHPLKSALDGLALLELKHDGHYFTSFEASSAAGAAAAPTITHCKMHISAASPLRVPSLMMRV